MQLPQWIIWTSVTSTFFNLLVTFLHLHFGDTHYITQRPWHVLSVMLHEQLLAKYDTTFKHLRPLDTSYVYCVFYLLLSIIMLLLQPYHQTKHWYSTILHCNDMFNIECQSFSNDLFPKYPWIVCTVFKMVRVRQLKHLTIMVTVKNATLVAGVCQHELWSQKVRSVATLSSTPLFTPTHAIWRAHYRLLDDDW